MLRLLLALPLTLLCVQETDPAAPVVPPTEPAPVQDDAAGGDDQATREREPRADPAEAVAPGVPGMAPDRSLTTLAALQRIIDAKETELERVRGQLSSETAGELRAELVEQARALQEELDQAKLDYESIATGIDVAQFEQERASEFNLQEELQKLLRPIIEELKQATEAPRQIERLRNEVAYFEEREALAREALAHVERLLASLEGGEAQLLSAGLQRSRDAWQARVEEIVGQRTVARFQLDNRLSERTSLLESTQSALGTFFRTRGLNLLAAVLAFVLVLAGLRTLYRSARKLLPGKPREERPFYARVMDVLYFAFVGTIALLASLLVLYAADDWVLLGLTLLFLLGLAWASKTAIPMFLEQIRLLLNLGAVRERERVVLDGVPYRVLKISFYSLVANAELAGGVRRLPIRDLIDMRSRTCSKDEIWFPCRRGQWVLLSDGKRGKVVHQSPDSVQIELLGGSLVTYATTDFLGLSPQNLSAGFRLSIRFGIDYQHQAISTTEVPRVLAERVRAGLAERYGEECLTGFKVEFLEAGASSLDYAVIADVSGEQAAQYEAMQRAIQRLCVDTCNEEGWVIPFTQITLHQA